MQVEDFLRKAEHEFSEACATAIASGPFAAAAEGIRRHLRSATRCLVNCKVLAQRRERERVGQRHFDWDSEERGSETVKHEPAPPARVPHTPAEPAASEGEGGLAACQPHPTFPIW